MALPWWLPFGPVPEISPADLARELGGPQPPRLLDVRTATEFAAGHLQGATSAPITGLVAAWPALDLAPGRPVVAICLTAHRSIPAVRLLLRRGLHARQLAGGMMAWRAAGLPEVKGASPAGRGGR